MGARAAGRETRRRPRMPAYEIPQQRAWRVRVFIWSMLASEYENKEGREGERERERVGDDEMKGSAE